MSKPSIPKGTRDFGPKEMVRRNYIFDTIRSSFQRYGYLPIETPSMEKTETLMGKYGEEGDRLIFRIMPRGRSLEKGFTNLVKKSFDDAILSEQSSVPNALAISSIAEEALRYDLTVPFARFVVQHQNDISFPFKRYQIQPVWRADRPQKGRYREFYQCDADVVGSDSLLYEVELVQLFDEVLSNLHIPDFTIKINNRKVLSGLAVKVGESDKMIDITVAIDKLDKIGPDGVVKELTERGVSDSAIAQLRPLLDGGLEGTNVERLDKMAQFLEGSQIGLKGIEELRFVLDNVEKLGLKNAKVDFDVTLARGLNYYTGAIFEVKANGVKIGSICGGGRYDDLTGIFGMPGVSGVGISFGADRIYDVLEELELFPAAVESSTRLLFLNFGEAEATYCLKMLKAAREAGINAEIYPSSAKMKKQMKYANDKQVPFVAIVGSQELVDGTLSLKNMDTGDQQVVDLATMIEAVNS